jgi:hypothetical protein
MVVSGVGLGACPPGSLPASAWSWGLGWVSRRQTGFACCPDSRTGFGPRTGRAYSLPLWQAASTIKSAVAVTIQAKIS